MSTAPDRRTIESIVASACRAPSLHNSQPWRWVYTGTELRLYGDPNRHLPAADPTGRQLVISCGATLDHLRLAAAERRWAATITRLPDRTNVDYLAAVKLAPAASVVDAETDRARAIQHRRTDRLVFMPPSDWPAVEHELRAIAAHWGCGAETIPQRRRPELAFASAQSAARRRYDSSYKTELQWWTGHSKVPFGVPAEALPSSAEAGRVHVGRKFPSVEHGAARRVEVGLDRSALLVLTTAGDTRLEWLRCGEALSSILLEATAQGLATCPLTHITELSGSRALVAKLLTGGDLPQVVVRIGRGTGGKDAKPTPRRALSEVLFVATEVGDTHA